MSHVSLRNNGRRSLRYRKLFNYGVANCRRNQLCVSFTQFVSRETVNRIVYSSTNAADRDASVGSFNRNFRIVLAKRRKSRPRPGEKSKCVLFGEIIFRMRTCFSIRDLNERLLTSVAFPTFAFLFLLFTRFIIGFIKQRTLI